MSENMSLPKVTVIIPNHNYSKWIGDAILSVVADPYPSKRIMVVDDGSTDNSWDVICRLGGMKCKNPNEKTIYQGKISDIDFLAYHFDTAGGPSRARNLGINALWDKTDVFGFLDADDMYVQGKILKSIQEFAKDPKKIGAVYTDYDTLNEDGLLTRVYKEPFNRYRLLQECIVHSACMINKEALSLVGLYDETMRTCEDYDLWIRISERFIITHIPETLMVVRVGAHNSTATVDRHIWEKNWNKIRQKLEERLKNG